MRRTKNEKTIPTTKTFVISEALPGIAMVEDLSLAPPDRVVGSTILGTAFAADARGYFLTAKHVVRGLQAHHLELRTTFKAKPGAGYGMFHFGVDAIYPHPVLDIAVLAVPALCTEGRVNLTLDSREVPVGTDVAIVGYASGTELVFCDDMLGKGSPKSFSPVAFNGMICARVPDDVRRVELFVYDCTTFGGNSGSPVISINSKCIVGVHLRGYENHVGYAVPIEQCVTFINSVAAIHEPRRPIYTPKRMQFWRQK